MKARKYAIAEFDVNSFVTTLGDFWLRLSPHHKLSEMMPYCDDTTIWHDWWSRPNDILGELVKDNVILFLAFHEPLAGQAARCVDGGVIPKGYKEALLRSYGYAIRLDGEVFEIRLAVTDRGPNGGPPIILYDDCGIYEERLEQFINRFVKK